MNQGHEGVTGTSSYAIMRRGVAESGAKASLPPFATLKIKSVEVFSVVISKFIRCVEKILQ